MTRQAREELRKVLDTPVFKLAKAEILGSAPVYGPESQKDAESVALLGAWTGGLIAAFQKLEKLSTPDQDVEGWVEPRKLNHDE